MLKVMLYVKSYVIRQRLHHTSKVTSYVKGYVIRQRLRHMSKVTSYVKGYVKRLTSNLLFSYVKHTSMT